jgi:superfamily I DNA and/or RNA helicase
VPTTQSLSQSQADSAASMGLVGVDNGAHKKQRLLLCAPSNAAVDELLLRLLKGVYNSHGMLVVVKVRYFCPVFLHLISSYHISNHSIPEHLI